jgi:hypothetical protein
MSRGYERRQRLFEKYVANRNLLIANGIINGERDVYLCPICQTKYTSIDGDNPLTLEDAPPKSLGGSANVLTCKSCNNSAGHNIDFHLAERLMEIDGATFLPGTETKVKVSVEGEIFNATIRVDGEGIMSMHHSNKNNHPKKLEEKMIGLRNGDIVDLNFLKTRVIPDNLEYALLKSAYILAFQKHGSSIIFDPCFDIARAQLLNPFERIYPENFWIIPPYPKDMEGVYFICDEGLESIFVLFNLYTGKSMRKIGVFLPCGVREISDVLNRIQQKFEDEREFVVNAYPLEQAGTNYLEDINEITSMLDWLNQRK